MVFKNLKKRVSYFKVVKEELYLVDEVNRVLKFDKDLLLIGGFKLKFNNNKPTEKCVKMDKNAKLLAVASNNLIGVWDLKSKKFLGSFQRKDDILSISLDEEYLVSGGVSGEIKLYNLEIKKEIGTIIKHKDFVTDLEIESEINEVYGGCYDKAVVFCDLITYRKKERYLHIKPVRKIEKKETLITADQISDILKWDVVKTESKDRVDFYKEFRDFWIDDNFLVILMNSKVAIYDLEKEVILNDNFLEINEGDKIVVFGRFMLISDIKGVLYKFDLFEDEEKLLDLILKEDFKRAYELVDKNPFLKRTLAFEKLEKLVEAMIKRAKAYFETDKEKAIEILQKLLVVPHLRGQIENIIRDFENIVKFKFAIKSGNYALAYQLANQFPLLKETKYYELLEKKWQITFEKALKLIKEGKISEAKELLEPFMAVPTKLPLIEFALKKANILFLMKEKLAKRDFKGFFDLVKLHPELKDTIEYQKVLEYGKRLLEKAEELFEKEEFEKAKRALNILLDFPDYAPKAQKLLKKIEIALEFQRVLANKDYEKAYELIELYPFLKRLLSYKEFMKKIHNAFKEAEKFMSENKKADAINTLKEFQNRFTMGRIGQII